MSSPHLPRSSAALPLALVCLVVGCSSPLPAGHDAGQDADQGSGQDAAAPEAQRDLAPSPPELAPDLPAVTSDVKPGDLGGGGDERQLGGVPKGFRIDNHGDRTVYLAAGPPVACAKDGPSGLEDCSFFASGCGASCTTMDTSRSCCNLCATPAPSVQAIAPGKSYLVTWSGTMHAAVACAQCSCDGESPVPANVPFQASVSVYPEYSCSSQDCFPDGSGLVAAAVPAGSPMTYTVVFAIPYLADEVVFDIGPPPLFDGGTPDGSNLREVAAAGPTVDTPADLPSPADAPSDGFPTMFAGIVPGGTFLIASEGTPIDAGVGPSTACRPPTTPAHYELNCQGTSWVGQCGGDAKRKTVLHFALGRT